jgi:hypothetical protein
MAVSGGTITTLTTTSGISVQGLTVGRGAGSVSTNTAVGASALAANTSGSSNTAVGVNALAANTTAAVNTAVGWNALPVVTTGGYNTATGSRSLYSNTTARYNSAFGEEALYSNTTGENNTALGMSALLSNTTASYNTAVGYQAGYSFNRTADVNGGNTFIGHQSGYGVTTGQDNSFVGQNSGAAVTTGSNNSILGSYNGNQGGLDIRTASNYIVLSDGDGNPRQVIDNYNTVYFDTVSTTAASGGNVFFGPTASGAPRLVTGHATGTPSGNQFSAYNYAGTTIGSISQNGTTAVLYNTTSDYRLKTDVAPINNALSIIGALNPISFTWVDGRKDDGFLAHEMQAIIPSCVTGEKDAVDEDGNPVYQQMDNSGVIPFLVKAIQELKAEFDAYKEAHP